MMLTKGTKMILKLFSKNSLLKTPWSGWSSKHWICHELDIDQIPNENSAA